MKEEEQNEEIKNIIIETIKNNNPKTTSELINYIQKQYNFNENILLNKILELNKLEIINFKKEDIKRPIKFTAYLFSKYSSWFWMIIVFNIINIIIITSIKTDNHPYIYIRYISGMLFLFFIPGFSLIKLLSIERNINNFEKTLLSIGCSIAIIPITGLLLNYIEIQITIYSIVFILVFLATIFSGIAIFEEYRINNET